jgi:hypothetical protein
MDSDQIAAFLRETGCTHPRVLASDELETARPLDPGQILVVNTDTSRGRGIHWILFYVTDDYRRTKILNYFDPLGECSLEYGKFKKFISNYDVLVSNEGFPVQHDSTEVFSNTCAMHVLFHAHLVCDYREKYRGLEDVMRVYDLSNTSESVNDNECMVLRYLNARFARHARIFAKLRGCVR